MKPQEIFDAYEKLLNERLENPGLDNSAKTEELHKKLNDMILDELGMKDTFGYSGEER